MVAWRTWAEKRTRFMQVPRWFALLAAAAFLLRGLLLWQYLGSPFSRSPVGDEFSCWLRAERIIRVGWAPEGVFYQGPLFPYFLAVLKTIFPSFNQVALAALQLLLNWLTCLSLLFLLRRNAGERIALAASALALFFAPAVFFALKGTTATIGLSLLVAGLLALPYGNRGGAGRCFLAGVLAGLMALAIPSFILAACAMLSFLFLRPPAGKGGRTGWAGRLSLPAAFVFGALLAILPVTVSNYLQDGSLVLISSNSGEMFLLGNNPRSDGTYTPFQGLSVLVQEEERDAGALARREAGRFLNAQEVGRHFFLKGLAFIRAEPLRWAALEGRKLVLLASGLDIPYEFSMMRERRDFLSLLWCFPVNGTLVLLLASLGLLVPAGRRALMLMFSTSLGLGAICIVFYAGNRYAYPCHFFLLPAAAAGLYALPGLRWRPLRALAFLPVLLMALLAGVWLRDAVWEETGYQQKLSIAYEELGDMRNTAGTLQRMMETAPDDPYVFTVVGRAYQRNGDLEFALRAFEHALRLSPGDADATLQRSLLLWEMGRREEALAGTAGLLEQAPEDFRIRMSYIQMLERSGNAAGIEQLWQAGLSIDPYSSALHLGFADWLAREGRMEEAARERDLARRLDPVRAAPGTP
jgi:tetratricopeptide (TPR) repeat protein